VPNPRLGYALTALSAACSALNGSLARYLLDERDVRRAALAAAFGGRDRAERQIV
jgi:hypothetical protein